MNFTLVKPLTFQSNQAFRDTFAKKLENGYEPENIDVLLTYIQNFELKKDYQELYDNMIAEFDDLMTNSVMEGNHSSVFSYLGRLFNLSAEEFVNTFHGQNVSDEDRMLLLTRLQNYLMRLRTRNPQISLIPAKVLFNWS